MDQFPYTRIEKKGRELMTPLEFIDYLKRVRNIDLSSIKTPIHIVSCFGVSNGVYQEFANQLKVTVYGYGDGGPIKTSPKLTNHIGQNAYPIKSVAGDPKNETDNLKEFPATAHTFHPQKYRINGETNSK